jgi:hypothetical protein
VPDFHVTNLGQSSYVIGGANNPTLTLTRGQTYTFTLDNADHPLWITSARGADSVLSDQYSQGVTGNGAAPSTLTFVVPPSAPATLFYQCQYHDPMGGTLSIVAPPVVPSIGRVASAALGGLLLLGALTILRRRGQNAMAAMRSQDQ